MLEGSDDIFDISIAEYISIIGFDVGDKVTIEYKAGEETNTVLSLNGEEKSRVQKDADDGTEE